MPEVSRTSAPLQIEQSSFDERRRGGPPPTVRGAELSCVSVSERIRRSFRWTSVEDGSDPNCRRRRSASRRPRPPAKHPLHPPVRPDPRRLQSPDRPRGLQRTNQARFEGGCACAWFYEIVSAWWAYLSRGASPRESSRAPFVPTRDSGRTTGGAGHTGAGLCLSQTRRAQELHSAAIRECARVALRRGSRSVIRAGPRVKTVGMPLATAAY